MKSNRGFSLLELAVVLSIISLLVAIGAPGIIKWRQDHQLNSEIRHIQATIQRMRMQALKEKSSVEIKFDPVANDYEARILMRGMDGGKTKVLKHQLPPGIRISRITFRNCMLRFNGRGLPAGGAGSVSLINQRGVVRRIVVPITGNSRISI
jgi:prepilin-type N-terminal cleavage/methylation domain-containing protein